MRAYVIRGREKVFGTLFQELKQIADHVSEWMTNDGGATNEVAHTTKIAVTWRPFAFGNKVSKWVYQTLTWINCCHWRSAVRAILVVAAVVHFRCSDFIEFLVYICRLCRRIYAKILLFVHQYENFAFLFARVHGCVCVCVCVGSDAVNCQLVFYSKYVTRSWILSFVYILMRSIAQTKPREKEYKWKQ